MNSHSQSCVSECGTLNAQTYETYDEKEGTKMKL